MAGHHDPASVAYYASVTTLKKKLGTMPAQVTLPDPVNRVEFTFSKDDLFTLVGIDVSALVVEAQTLPMLLVQVARARRGAEVAAAKAEQSYRIWKSERIEECNKNAGDKKKPTGAEQEAFYRTHRDYETYQGAGDYYKHLAEFFGDVIDALRHKAKMIDVIERRGAQHEAFERAADRENDVAASEAEARIEALSRPVLDKYVEHGPFGRPMTSAERAMVDQRTPPPEVLARHAAGATVTSTRIEGGIATVITPPAAPPPPAPAFPPGMVPPGAVPPAPPMAPPPPAPIAPPDGDEPDDDDYFGSEDEDDTPPPAPPKPAARAPRR